ncbi:MAG TPA: GreA/GreB family elongation factor [Opitutaceae bacterium]|nr:GreA/GreB family elongation factor [Opitutaceae bacterium]
MIHIRKDDYLQLSLLLSRHPEAAGRASLRDELAAATVLPRENFPADVVAMNSRVGFVDLDSGEHEEYTLTLPQHADAEARRLSVLSPIGTALLGYRVGDEVSWPTPGGARRLRIVAVTHGEAPTAGEAADAFLVRLLGGIPVAEGARP